MQHKKRTPIASHSARQKKDMPASIAGKHYTHTRTNDNNTQETTMMINVKILVNKALQGDERAYRALVSRYGKVTTAQLLKDGARQCRQ